jgi:hypothetical protein
MTYEQNKPSVPLAITVPHYNAVEFLSASSYLTQMGIISPHIQPHDLFSKLLYCAVMLFVSITV